MDSLQIMAHIDDFISQKEKEDAERQKAHVKSRGKSSGGVASFNPGPGTWSISTADAGTNWYFYNSTALSIGRNEFIRNWGNRRLEDN
jgi:hypothetical protein